MLGSRERYTGYDDSRSVFMEDNRHYASDASPSSSLAAACNRSNRLFWPVVALSCLTVLFFILTIAGFSRSTSSSSPATYPPYSLYSLVGPPLILPTTPATTPLTFTILQMNDVYELLPLANNTRGGLARCAYIRSLLRQQDPSTLTVMAGDLLSPSALSSASVNGTALAGRQMVNTLNGWLDLMVYGNHEFDLIETNLQSRLSEATFTWLSANTFQPDTNSLFPAVGTNAGINKGYVIRQLNGVRVLIIGLTIDANMGTPSPYVYIANVAQSIQLAKQLIASLQGQYDVVVALTHWDLTSDQALVEQVPAIQFVMGGHEHANYHITRGIAFTPINKADSNDATVYIHRFAYYPTTHQLITQSYLQTIDQSVPELPAVAQTANQWFTDGMNAFIAQGFQPYAVVIVLAADVEWDGRSEVVRSDPSNRLTQTICQSLLYNTTSNSTMTATNQVALFNTGSVRVDDVLTGELTQYDILRILPFNNVVQSVTVNGSLLRAVLTWSQNVAGNGNFLSTCGGLSQQSTSGGSGGGSSWQVNNVTIADATMYVVRTSNYMVNNTALMSGVKGPTGLLMSQQFITYLQGPTYVPDT